MTLGVNDVAMALLQASGDCAGIRCSTAQARAAPQVRVAGNAPVRLNRTSQQTAPIFGRCAPSFFGEHLSFTSMCSDRLAEKQLVRYKAVLWLWRDAWPRGKN